MPPTAGVAQWCRLSWESRKRERRLHLILPKLDAQGWCDPGGSRGLDAAVPPGGGGPWVAALALGRGVARKPVTSPWAVSR